MSEEHGLAWRIEDTGAAEAVWELTATEAGPGRAAGVGFAGYLDGKLEIEEGLPVPDATNQQAEIIAAVFALTMIPAEAWCCSTATARTSSKPSSRSTWKQNGWSKGPGKGMAANTEHWTDLLDAVALHEDVEFHLCKGHSGVEGNVIADRLAGLARKEALGLWGQAA